MKSLFLLCLLALACVHAEETYTTENDDLDIHSLVNNLEHLQAFVNCFIDKATCDQVSGAFKKDLPEAVRTACAKCTPAQKHIFKVFLQALKEKLVQPFEEFKKKYDPEGNHLGPLEQAVASS